jgi:hypothetical protein
MTRNSLVIMMGYFCFFGRDKAIFILQIYQTGVTNYPPLNPRGGKYPFSIRRSKVPPIKIRGGEEGL